MTPLLPLESSILISLNEQFQRVAGVTSLLVGLLFMARMTLLVVSISGPSGYGELIKDTFQYFIFVSLFPKVFSLLNEILGAFAFKLYFEPKVVEPGFFDQILNALKEIYPVLNIFMTLSPTFICHLAQALSTLLIAILVTIGPVIILLNTMFDFNKGISTYFTAIFSLCLWPVLWNLLGSLSNSLWPSFEGTSFLKIIYVACVQCIQLISPIICIFLFSSLAPGQAISKVVTRIPISKMRLR